MPKREFSAGGIIIKKRGRDIKVLLIKDSYGRWTWPKGNIQKGESIKGAALREIREEVGLKNIKIIDEVGKSQYFYKLKGESIFKRVSFYVIEAIGNERVKVQREEISGAKWFQPTMAMKKLDYKGAPRLLKRAINIFKKKISEL